MNQESNAFFLYDNNKKLVQCSTTLKDVVNYFPEKTYTTEMWNSLWHAKSPEARQTIFENNGWYVKSKTITFD